MVVPKTKEDNNAYRSRKTKPKSKNSTAEEGTKEYVVQKIKKNRGRAKDFKLNFHFRFNMWTKYENHE